MGGIDLLIYWFIDLFCNTFTFRATTHDVTARNYANSEHDTHDDKNHVRNWHPFYYIDACFYISWMHSIMPVLCET